VATGSNPVTRIKKSTQVDFFNLPNKEFCSAQDLNAGAMFGERAGEPNREAVARPRRRKPSRAEAKSYHAYKKIHASGFF
jgi:hypothetical protein